MDVMKVQVPVLAGVVAEVQKWSKFNVYWCYSERWKACNQRHSKTPCKAYKKCKEAEHPQSQMVNMLNQEDHEIDLVFQAMSKRIKKKLSDEEVEDLMEELSNTVTKHVKLACKKKLERQKHFSEYASATNTGTGTSTT